MAEYKNKYSYRFLARVVIETTTPISIGSGEANILTDQMVARDTNQLPYIPGTAIAGIVRHAVGEEMGRQFFGNSSEGKEDQGNGSEIIFSSAYLLNSDNVVVEGLNIDIGKSSYLSRFNCLPIRQHVRIGSDGTAIARGKFDNEIVYKGTRFCFDIEMVSAEDAEEDKFKNILKTLSSDVVRAGSGTRSGYGGFKVVESKISILNLRDESQLRQYIEKSSSLNDPFWQTIKADNISEIGEEKGWKTDTLTLQPNDFFIFGSGFGNENADATSVTEPYIDWTNDSPRFVEDAILIPASSIKGALAHRVAFHYNKLGSVFLDQNSDLAKLEKHVGENNEAIRALFGYVENNMAKQGQVILSDVIIVMNPKAKAKHVQKHVVIDSFTGGAEKGKLFQEELLHKDNLSNAVELTIHVRSDIDQRFTEALKLAIVDLQSGNLALGGLTNRGNGTFNAN